MVKVAFTPNLARHVDTPVCDVTGPTVREALDQVFAANPRLKGYVLDDQGGLRRHMTVFVGDRQVQDRVALTDAVPPDARIFVAQALSGG